MEHKGLLFIPDISGFSRFVTETEIDHSRLVIQELLEILINANDLGLKISEIEGDAILFYKFGEPPSLEALYRQVEKMFCTFHESLLAYEMQRYCQCRACMSAKELTLKVITHYGEFTVYNVKSFQKLIGKDIIVAHQLLKNDIPQHEYWILTPNVTAQPPELTQWMRWNESVKHLETGDIHFHYTQLGDLRREVRNPRIRPVALESMAKVFSVSKEYETDIITMFHASGDFQYRNRWQEGVEKVDILNHYLPRVGMKCKCVINGKETIIYSSSYRYQDDRIEFVEAEESGRSATSFLLERVEPDGGVPVQGRRTRLTLDYYVRMRVASRLFFRLFEKNIVKKQYLKSLGNLVPLVRELKIPSAV
jgi:hypothetical protein